MNSNEPMKMDRKIKEIIEKKIEEWKLQNPGYSGKVNIQINYQNGTAKDIHFGTDERIKLSN